MPTPTTLWPHQRDALRAAEASDFASGTHAHATGTGKSVLGHALVRAFAERYPGVLLLWMCEQAGVVAEIFSRPVARQGLLVCDLVNRKPADWWSTVQSALCWGKPVLVIVNRAFLVSQRRYERLRRATVGLVVHDECHTGTGPTTRAFYEWLDVAHPQARIVGLSATPPALADAPHPALATIRSRYSLYDATADGTIVPLRMGWCDHQQRGRLSHKASARLVRTLADRARIQKVIVWCGTIDHCYTMAGVWREAVRSADPPWLLAVDTSQPRTGWPDYAAFCATTGRGVLFCAAKHREGSDIPGLGMGVFVDGVETRGAAVFVQCAGRVLRRPRDGTSKPYGLLLDLRARDGLTLCDRVGEYLQLPTGTMPWRAATETAAGFTVHTLTLTPATPAEVERAATVRRRDALPNVCAHDLPPRFVRPVPAKDRYTERVAHELATMDAKGLAPHLVRAIEVLALAGMDVPHVTRGSCGSSLVCYLLGISHVDPVAHGICFARFLNEFRDSLPDIDFDFPHHRRADIFLRMAIRWPGTVARISNHVHFHEKSALRQALREHGHKSNVPAGTLPSYLRGLPTAERQAIEATAETLDGNFHCYSLHCGGVVYYPEGVPADALLEGKGGKLLAQVKADKRDVAKAGHFKIDVLSSRALAQLMEAVAGVYDGASLPLDAPPFTQSMAAMLARGDNLGLTLAESPLCRAEFKAHAPTSVGDVAACLARIRPAARQSEGTIVYDDDAIRIVAEAVGCSTAEADGLRRGLAKRDPATASALRARLGAPAYTALEAQLGSLSLYGFCKAHAMSYAQLVTWLAWCKVERPKAFWRGALNHCHTSYRPWVHLWEAWRAGVDPFALNLSRNDVSVYTAARRRSFHTLPTTMAQLRAHGYWDVRKGFLAGCYATPPDAKGRRRFRGVVAASRRLREGVVALCVGTGDEYLDVTAVVGKAFTSKVRLVTGWLEPDGREAVECVCVT